MRPPRTLLLGLMGSITSASAQAQPAVPEPVRPALDARFFMGLGYGLVVRSRETGVATQFRVAARLRPGIHIDIENGGLFGDEDPMSARVLSFYVVAGIRWVPITPKPTYVSAPCTKYVDLTALVLGASAGFEERTVVSSRW
jgi:hypothetical protein